MNGDLEGCIKADVLFHVSVAEATHNTILAEMYRSITLPQPLHDKLVKFISEGNVKSAARIGESFWGMPGFISVER